MWGGKKPLIWWLVGLAALWASPAHSEQERSSIKGRLLSESGAPIPQAHVWVLELDRSTTTERDGSFELTDVPPGTYRVLAQGTSWASEPYQVTVKRGETSELTLIVELQKLRFEEEITVKSRADDMIRLARSGSEGVTGQVDLQARPILRVGELVETVPGVIATQHSGGGKANQYFVRGFNLDHGTDFAVAVDGVPVNLPSHGHGQGYLDLNFLIPELVEKVSFRKGIYYADEGDFSAAGSARFSLHDRLERPLVKVTAGEYDYERAVLAGSKSLLGGELLSGLELYHYDGPWEHPDDFRKANVVLRYSRRSSRSGFRLTAQSYTGRWSSSDQIPQRAVEAGRVSRFGSLDPTDGGFSGRHSLSGEVWRAGKASLTRLTAYGVRYDLKLFSNFTYALNDPVNGDQFEQRDERWIAGFSLEHRRGMDWRGRQVDSVFGVELRNDGIQNGLFGTRERRRLSTVRADDITELGGAAFVESRIVWNGWLRTTAGLRADLLDIDVTSDHPLNSGTARAAMASPKLSIVFGPWDETEIYANWGGGFHSNDARGATISVDPITGEPLQKVQPLVRAWGFDLGFRTRALRGLHAAVSFFGLDLASELVFAGDTGGTEASRPSRRLGLELANFYQPFRWLKLDVDLALSRARFHDRDPDNRIPGAMEKVLSAGVSIEGLSRWTASLRWRYFGSRPLVEDNSVRARPSSLVNTRMGYQLRDVTVGLEVFNLFSTPSNDIDYYYTSRLPGEPSAGVDDIHFHPAESRTLRLFIDWRP